VKDLYDVALPRNGSPWRDVVEEMVFPAMRDQVRDRAMSSCCLMRFVQVRFFYALSSLRLWQASGYHHLDGASKH